MYIIYDLLFFLFWQNQCRFKLWVTQANACWTTRQNHRSMMRAEQCTACCASTHHAAQNVYHLLRWKRLTEIHSEKLADIQKKLESFHTFQNMIPYITAFVNPVFGIFFLGALWVAFRKKRQDSICATSWNRPSGFRSWRDNFWQPFSKGKLPQLLEFTAWILANCHFKKVPSHVVRVLFCQQPVTVTGVFL